MKSVVGGWYWVKFPAVCCRKKLIAVPAKCLATTEKQVVVRKRLRLVADVVGKDCVLGEAILFRQRLGNLLGWLVRLPFRLLRWLFGFLLFWRTK